MGGSGKSKIWDWLFFDNKNLSKYYHVIGKSETHIPIDKLMYSKITLNFDELPLNKVRYSMFKSYIQKEFGNDYNKASGNYDIEYKRIMSFCGSANKVNRKLSNGNVQEGYLFDSDPAMFRRIIPIEIEGRINYQYYLDNISREDIIAQSVYDIRLAHKNGNKKILTSECDYEDLRIENVKYINKNAIEIKELANVLKLFPKSPKKGEGTLMRPSDIIDSIQKQGLKIDLSPDSLGRLLIKNDYFMKRIPGGSAYWVQM